MEMLFYVAIALCFFLTIALMMTPVLLRPSRVETRLLGVVDTTRKDERRIGEKERLEEQMLAIVRRLTAMVGLSQDEQLKLRLASAGLRSARCADFYSAVRVIAPLAGILIATVVCTNTFMGVLVGGAIGYIAPDMWLRRRIKRRREKIRKGIPDMIDLLMICMDAGLGLDQGLLRVGQELAFTQPEICHELTQLNLEQRAGKPRMEAWQSMADRTQVEDIASFVKMLVQADRFGTPILGALNRLGSDIRLKRRQHAEEMAAKSKVKILFPLVLFIFPCIFIVLLAPALLNMGKILTSISK